MKNKISIIIASCVVLTTITSFGKELINNIDIEQREESREISTRDFVYSETNFDNDSITDENIDTQTKGHIKSTWKGITFNAKNTGLMSIQNPQRGYIQFELYNEENNNPTGIKSKKIKWNNITGKYYIDLWGPVIFDFANVPVGKYNLQMTHISTNENNPEIMTPLPKPVRLDKSEEGSASTSPYIVEVKKPKNQLVV